MLKNIKWLFFDIGSTIVDETIAYEHRIKEMADSVQMDMSIVYNMVIEFYKQNKKGDLETAKILGVELSKWHIEDEILYKDAFECLKKLSAKYKIGIIANQAFGTKKRLQHYGLLQYISLIVASQEEGVAKPDKRIFEIALERSKCNPNNAVMIGDRIDNDIIPANLMGMHTIWIKQGFGQYWHITKNIEKADYIVNNLMEICDILLK